MGLGTRSISIIFLFFFAAFQSALGQVWSYAKHCGSMANDYGSHIVLDAEGNTYLLGEYTGTATLDTIVVQSQGKWNAILAKYNPSGTIIWARTIASTKDPLSDLYANAFCLDRSGNIYIGGKFLVDITISDTSFTCIGSSDMYLAKFSATGSLLWAKQAGRGRARKLWTG